MSVKAETLNTDVAGELCGRKRPCIKSPSIDVEIRAFLLSFRAIPP
jgi:hypothetical protein